MLDSPLAASPQGLSSSPAGASRHGSHQLAAALTCARLYVMRYVLGYTSKPEYDPHYRLIGSLMHVRLAYLYADLVAIRPDWIDTAPPLEQVLEEVARGRPDLIRLTKDVADYYENRWATGDPWRPMLVEHSFTATIAQLDPTAAGRGDPADDVELTAKCDLVIESNGGYWLVDHKCQRGRGNYLDAWTDDGEFRLSWQPLLYMNVARVNPWPLDKSPEGFFIQRIKRSPPYDVDRTVLRMPQMAYQSTGATARRMVHAEQAIHRDLAAGIKPTPNYAACMGRFGACDYRDICAASCPQEQVDVLATKFDKRL